MAGSLEQFNQCHLPQPVSRLLQHGEVSFQSLPPCRRCIRLCPHCSSKSSAKLWVNARTRRIRHDIVIFHIRTSHPPMISIDLPICISAANPLFLYLLQFSSPFCRFATHLTSPDSDEASTSSGDLPVQSEKNRNREVCAHLLVLYEVLSLILYLFRFQASL